MRQLGLGQNLKLKDLFIYTLCSKHFQNVNLVKKKICSQNDFMWNQILGNFKQSEIVSFGNFRGSKFGF